MAVLPKKTSRVDRDGKDGAGWYIPNVVSQSVAWRSMTLGEFRLITDAASLFNLNNNGHIAMSFSYMRKHFGWSSSDTLNSAKEGLIRKGLLVKTRQGDANQTPDLFALTWLSLNRGDDKLDIDPIAWNRSHRGAYARWTPDPTTKKRMPKPDQIKLISRVRRSDGLRQNIVRPSDGSM